VLGIAAVMSWLSFISRFFGLKLIAGMSWFVAFIVVVNNPPTGITAGSSMHTGLIVVIIGFGLMIVVSGFRAIKNKSSKIMDAKGNSLEQTEESGSWHFPSWVANMNPEHEERERRQKRVDKVVAYRERVHTVLNQRRNRR